ncbi:hypothetical protein CEV33_3284 [Brucella grignonensis]|uniref:Uncharacterized protein n=1 Tax=Brucella grignonensis TaxID=94627 RepID=A0A256F1V8_9HYPH|nr:hypothetical protein CEV33_3284 [Brucella grignonensis]
MRQFKPETSKSTERLLNVVWSGTDSSTLSSVNSDAIKPSL